MIDIRKEMFDALQTVLDDENAGALSEDTLSKLDAALKHAQGLKSQPEYLQAVKDRMARENFVLHARPGDQERLREMIAETPRTLADVTERACNVIMFGGRL